MKHLLYIAGLEALLFSAPACTRVVSSPPVVQREDFVVGRVLSIHAAEVRYRLRERQEHMPPEDVYRFFYVQLATPEGKIHTILYPYAPAFRSGHVVRVSVQPFQKTMTVKDLVDQLSSRTYETDDTTAIYANSIASH